jgi:ABC-type sugar transport system substrate-binding protein
MRALPVTVGIGTAVIVLSTISACSSSSTSSSHADASTGASTSSTSALSAAVAAYTKQPVRIGDAPALKGPVPAGKKFIQISNGSPYDQLLSAGFKAAAAKVGWNFSVIQASLANPASTLSALTSAIAAGADAVEISATPIAVWKSAIPSARARGTLIITIAGAEDQTTDPAPPGVVYLQNNVANAAPMGKRLIDLALADAGSSASDLQMVATEVPQLGAGETALTAAERQELATKCSSCKLDTVQVPFADYLAGKGPQDVVTYLQSHPSTKYVLVSRGAAVSGITQAIQAASLPAVKILGGSPSPDELKDLASGKNVAWVLQPFQVFGWQAVDTAIRASLGQDAYTWPPFTWMVTKDNVGQVKDLTDPEFPPDYASQFATLWKTS